MATQQLNYFLAIVAFAFGLSLFADDNGVTAMDSTHITLGKDGDRCNVRIHAPEGRGEVTLDIKAPCEVGHNDKGKPYGVIVDKKLKTFILCGAVKKCAEYERGCGTGFQALVIDEKTVYATDLSKQKDWSKTSCKPRSADTPTYWISAKDSPLKKIGQLK